MLGPQLFGARPSRQITFEPGHSPRIRRLTAEICGEISMRDDKGDQQCQAVASRELKLSIHAEDDSVGDVKKLLFSRASLVKNP
jgi:hypothetical protein